MIDSMYSLLLYAVNIVLMPVSKLSMSFRVEVPSYVIVTGMDPGIVTLHVRCTDSLLDSMEHL